MTDAQPERHWSESFGATATSRAGEPAWLEAARKSAIARFVELGFPARGHEEWKYTNPAPIAKVAWTPAAAASVSRAALAALGLPLVEGSHLVFVNGRLAAELSSVAGWPVGSRAQPGIDIDPVVGPKSPACTDYAPSRCWDAGHHSEASAGS